MRTISKIKIWKVPKPKTSAQIKGELCQEYKVLTEDLSKTRKVKSTRSIRLTLFYLNEEGLDIFNKSNYRKVKAGRVYSEMEKIAGETGQDIEGVIKSFNYSSLMFQ